MKEVWYCYKELVVDDEGPRLLTPWSNPMKYEQVFDFLFKTPEEARETKADLAPDEDWVLCLRTLETVED